jgi:hypothetical protein
MTSLDQRESALETEFAHREELKFRARERAVRALANWAADRLGKTAQAAELYAAEIVAADVANTRIDPTIERITADLSEVGVREEHVTRMMERFLADANASVRA